MYHCMRYNINVSPSTDTFTMFSHTMVIIIGQQYSPVVSCGWVKASACLLQGLSMPPPGPQHASSKASACLLQGLSMPPPRPQHASSKASACLLQGLSMPPPRPQHASSKASACLLQGLSCAVLCQIVALDSTCLNLLKANI